MSSPPPSNVVPMPKAPAAAGQPPAAGQQMYPPWGGTGGPPWAMNPIYPIPPGPRSGGGLPWGPSGCCSSGGMDSLLQCYNDVAAATAFICSVMVTCVQNNPAVVQAIIAAIENSGSSLPTLGVTNGTDAQPGQVGEYFQNIQNITFPAAAQNTQMVTVGILQPGDWDCNAAFHANGYIDGVIQNLATTPPGFTTDMFGSTNVQTASGSEGDVNFSIPARALISVPSLVVFSLVTNYAGGAGGTTTTGTFYFEARRAR